MTDVRVRPRLPLDGTSLFTALAEAPRHGHEMQQLRFGPLRAHVVTDPAACWDLLTVHGRHTVKGRGLRGTRLVLGEGLLTSTDPTHREARRALQPPFHRSRMPGYAAKVAALSDRRAASWATVTTIDASAEMNALAVDVAGSALFGVDLGAEADGIAAALSHLLDRFALAALPYGAAALRRLPVFPRVRSSLAELDRVAERIVRETASLSGDEPTVGQELLAAVARGQVPAAAVRDHVVTFLLAGHETTGLVLAWAWHALAADPAARQLVEAEWDGLGTGDVTDPARLAVTTAVIAETLRLRPPAWVMGRRAVGPFQLGGVAVATGATLLVPIVGLQRDPQWWPDPDAFRPQRWLVADGDGWRFDAAAPGAPRGAFLPFGAGGRKCIGDHFAWIEASVALAAIGRRRRLTLAPGAADPGVAPRVTLRPAAPIRLQVRAVDGAASRGGEARPTAAARRS